MASDSEINEERSDAFKKQMAKLDHQEDQTSTLWAIPTGRETRSLSGSVTSVTSAHGWYAS